MDDDIKRQLQAWSYRLDEMSEYQRSPEEIFNGLVWFWNETPDSYWQLFVIGSKRFVLFKEEHDIVWVCEVLDTIMPGV